MTEQDFSNVKFICKQASEICSSKISSSGVLNVPAPIFRIETCYMEVYDPALDVTQGPPLTVIMKAVLQARSHRAKVQQLRLTSGARNTYFLSLEAKFTYCDRESVWALTGRNTTHVREAARFALLSGLSASNYDCSIEEARTKVLEIFTHIALNNLFPTNAVLMEENKPILNPWLTKLLG